MDFEGSIEVFVRAFAYLRSWTHPCLAEQIEGVWAMRDADRTRGEYRKEEWIVWKTLPAEVDRIARKHTRGRYFVGAFRAENEPMEPLRDAYKALGYRVLAREGFFVKDMAGFSRSKPKPNANPIERVTTQELADRLLRAARRRQILPEHLADPDSPLRQYVALSGKSAVGWVRSVTIGKGAWVSNLYVEKSHRRLGLGSALMERLLEDDAAAGIETSVLLASSTGALLYPNLGYERIGELLIFVPPKSQQGAENIDASRN